MLVAREISRWTNRYAVSRDGRRVTTLDAIVRDTDAGSFTLDGHRYALPGAIWDDHFTVRDGRRDVVAEAHRVDRTRWTIVAAGQTYHLRRGNFWGTRHQLDAGDLPLGMVYRVGGAERAVEADLSGVPALVEIFVLALVLAIRDNQTTNRVGIRSRWW
ncbi:hypothetical protein AB0J74_02555 [Asanoa sp. NPDC049573]|uniref:hypothetical protein n=1 Tax=Asanoa sp. NPDC049573 TaxID=3155396 RepID=UPI003445ACCC